MPQRQDYILRMIEELGRFVAEATKFRDAGHHDAALLAILRAQERLFARPSQDFMARTAEDQVRLLVVGESDANAVEKCRVYANLIVEAGLIYQAREQSALALGACHYALQVVDLARTRFPAGNFATAGARVAGLVAALPDSEMKSEIAAQMSRPSPAADPGSAPSDAGRRPEGSP